MLRRSTFYGAAMAENALRLDRYPLWFGTLVRPISCAATTELLKRFENIPA